MHGNFYLNKILGKKLLATKKIKNKKSSPKAQLRDFGDYRVYTVISFY